MCIEPFRRSVSISSVEQPMVALQRCRDCPLPGRGSQGRRFPSEPRFHSVVVLCGPLHRTHRPCWLLCAWSLLQLLLRCKPRVSGRGRERDVVGIASSQVQTRPVILQTPDSLL